MSPTREFAGTVNRRVTLESPSETGGDAVVTWTTQRTVWAEVEGLSGANRTGFVADAGFRFTIRYTTDAITPRWRVGLSGTSRKFQIQSVLDPDGSKVRLLILATELV